MRKLFSAKVRIILVVAVLITVGLTILSNTGTQILPGTVSQVLVQKGSTVNTGDAMVVLN
jgi:hypothetical protein